MLCCSYLRLLGVSQTLLQDCQKRQNLCSLDCHCLLHTLEVSKQNLCQLYFNFLFFITFGRVYELGLFLSLSLSIIAEVLFYRIGCSETQEESAKMALIIFMLFVVIVVLEPMYG